MYNMLVWSPNIQQNINKKHFLVNAGVERVKFNMLFNFLVFSLMPWEHWFLLHNYDLW